MNSRASALTMVRRASSGGKQNHARAASMTSSTEFDRDDARTGNFTPTKFGKSRGTKAQLNDAPWLGQKQPHRHHLPLIFEL